MYIFYSDVNIDPMPTSAVLHTITSDPILVVGDSSPVASVRDVVHTSVML